MVRACVRNSAQIDDKYIANVCLLADCPQVQAIHQYTAEQPDELSLEESDVINVHRKMTDGQYRMSFTCSCMPINSHQQAAQIAVLISYCYMRVLVWL